MHLTHNALCKSNAADQRTVKQFTVKSQSAPIVEFGKERLNWKEAKNESVRNMGGLEYK